MFAYLQRWLDRRIIQGSTIPPELWQQAYDGLPILQRLSHEEREALTGLAILLLQRKTFTAVMGLELSVPMMLQIALQACLPILYLGMHCYKGWKEIIVYPHGFTTRHEVMDEYGVVHQENRGLAGESWQRGPVVLAWDEASHAGIIDGHNLVIHEFAHKLDMQNGVANGFPPLHAGMSARAWEAAFSAAYQQLQQACEQGLHTEIDCYAASSPAEFFAVFSEMFFERPQVLASHYAATYEQLQLYYRQRP